MTRESRQGEIWWADAPEPIGRRPFLILTRNSIISRLSNVTVAPLTTRNRHIHSEVELDVSDGLDRKCVVSLDNIFTFEKDRLESRISVLSADRMDEVWEALRFAFDMPL